MRRYNPKEIEPKWQKTWDNNQTYKANLNSNKQKYIAMSMFNYPSGAGIHIGHAMNYTISDVMARLKRQQGFESYHPVGWDAFGLPAENYAIKTGVSPQASMDTIIPGYHKQYKAMGWSNDWSKEISTHEPIYYKWSQWIFSQMYRNGLAYQDSRMQWWCTKCQTVLANEQVIDGKCWRHDGPDDPIVEKKEVKQWFFKITDYADELLEATDALDWSESVKTAQKNWIGKSEGAEIDFAIQGHDQKLTVFTTRQDTIFGATFLVLAPEHELVEQIVADEHKSEVETYVKETTKKTEIERQASKDKTGVFTGAYAINPANQERIPIWIADYVLLGYGTGAVMAVPAHDERDNEFAQKYKLPIRQVIEPIYTKTTGFDAVREDQEFVERQAITAIIKHWSEDKYLGLRWKKADWDTFLTGGIEEGQTPEAAAIEEIKQETGYLHPKLVKNLDRTHAKFFHVPKDQNRFAHFHGMYFELQDGETEEISNDEKSKHEVIWLSPTELEGFRLPDSHRYLWEQLSGAVGVYDGEGILVNSEQFNGQNSAEVREKVAESIGGKVVNNYKIRDWSVSRQRYWGAPIPIINCPKCGNVLVSDDQLPVKLPELDDYAPSGDGHSALARAADWLKVECPKCGGPAERETDTLDTYICSSWYMLRYFDPANEQKIFDSKVVNKWMPIDFYNGADHATAHLIYARFVTRFLHKLGLVDNPEPFKRFLFNGKVVASDGRGFSKTLGNGPDPLEIIDQGYGADALRAYLMFAAPLELGSRWDPQGVPGTFRFLSRVWNLAHEFIDTNGGHGGESDAPLKIIHPAIKKVTKDLEDQKYNTAIAAMMKATNDLYELKAKDSFGNKNSWQAAIESLVMIIAPFAPHMTEELWQQLGHTDSVHIDHWPTWDEKYLLVESVTIVVQINGKLRAELQLPAGSGESEIIEAAKTDAKIVALIRGKEIKKTVFVPGKLVNLVI